MLNATRIYSFCKRDRKKKAYIKPATTLKSEKTTGTNEPKVAKEDKVEKREKATAELEAVKEPVTTSTSKPIQPTGGLSISALTTATFNKKEEEKKQEEFTSTLREEFSEETFFDCWKELAKKMETSEKNGASIIVAALRGRKPEIDLNKTISLVVDNKSMYEVVLENRVDLHAFLRKKLKNGAIKIELSIVKNDKEKKAYTSQDKLQKMVEKNPFIEEFRQKLGLEIH